MNRRKWMQSLGLATTHALFPSILANFVAGCQYPDPTQEDYAPSFFSREEFAVIREIVDIILPATQSKSAAQVNTHHFLDEVFDKCLSTDQQSLIKTGLAGLIPRFRLAGNKQQLLAEIDQKAYAGDAEHAYFRTIKQYTLIGFFTSQEGMTVASNYVKFPGDYKGDVKSDDHTLNYGKTYLQYNL